MWDQTHSASWRGDMLIKFLAAFMAFIVLTSAAPSWGKGKRQKGKVSRDIGNFNRDIKRCQNHRAKPIVRVRSCTRLIRSDRFEGKGLAVIFIARGNAFDDRGETDRAIQDYGAAIRLNPRDSRAYFNRGFVYGKTKDRLELAIRDFSEALRLDRADASTLQSRGIAYGKSGQWDRAISDYNEALRLKPDSASTFFNRGIAYDEKGDVGRAIEDYTASLRLDAGSAAVLHRRGLAYSKKGELDRAIADYNAAIQIRPRAVVVY